MLRKGLVQLASLRLTIVGLGLLLLAAGLTYRDDVPAVWTLVLPLSLLAINLLAAIASNPNFRRQPPLLVFHLALLAIVVLAGLGRLTYLVGRIELAEGELFEGVPFNIRAGVFHPGGLEALRFQSESLSIDYSTYGAVAEMRNQVRWADRTGQWQSGELRIKKPLVLGGYRVYLTSGKGFSALFQWHPVWGEIRSGAVHLPAFPANQANQTAEWSLPGNARSIWIQLIAPNPILPEGQASTLKPPADHRLVVRSGEVRAELVPGGEVRFPEGMLVYSGLRLWMGYHIFYDWTTSWLLAAALLAVVALAWHFLVRFSGRSWMD